MPVPLHIDSANLGHMAVRQTPRLASILMATHQSGEPLRVTSHPAGAHAGLGAMLVGDNPLGAWIRRTRQADQVSLDTAPVVARVKAPASARAQQRTLLSPIADIYKRLRSESGGEDRAKTIDELLDSANPAPAGQSTPAAKKSVLIPASSRENELALLSAGVVRYCFGDEARMGKGGSFETAVFTNLNSASNVIAPGKALSAMTATEIKAIVTVAVHSANPEFLRQLRTAPGVPQALSQAVSTVPAGAKVAAQFTKGGQFDEETFKSKTQAVDLDTLKLLASSPATIKIGLLAIAAKKASQLVDELPARRESMQDLADDIRDTIIARMELGEDAPRPGTRPVFDRPTAPGA